VQPVIRRELDGLAIRMGGYLHSPGWNGEIENVCGELKKRVRIALHEWLATAFPDMIETWANMDELWLAVEQEVLPAIRGFVSHRFKRDQQTIIRTLDLEGRIVRVIMAQSPAEVHQLINRVSGEHLVRLQILGYILGGLAGFLLVFAQ